MPATSRAFSGISGSTGTEGVLRSEDFIERVRQAINDVMNQCIREGDTLYYNAQEKFFSEDYVNAKSFALNASDKYHNCPYQPGIMQAASLLTSIEGKISEIRVNAKASYDKAIEYYKMALESFLDTWLEFDFARERIKNLRRPIE